MSLGIHSLVRYRRPAPKSWKPGGIHQEQKHWRDTTGLEMNPWKTSIFMSGIGLDSLVHWQLCWFQHVRHPDPQLSTFRKPPQWCLFWIAKWRDNQHSKLVDGRQKHAVQMVYPPISPTPCWFLLVWLFSSNRNCHNTVTTNRRTMT